MQAAAAGVLYDSSPSWFERVNYARSQWGGNGKGEVTTSEVYESLRPPELK